MLLLQDVTVTICYCYNTLCYCYDTLLLQYVTVTACYCYNMLQLPTLLRFTNAFSYSLRMACAVARLYCMMAFAHGRSRGDHAYSAPGKTRPERTLRHSTLGRSSVAGPAHQFPGFGATVIYYIVFITVS